MPIIDNWKLVVLERYAKFDGRANRAEYWWYVLAQIIAFVVLAVLANVSSVFVLLYMAFALGTLVPSIAVAIRRLHDTGKSGWWLLISFIPIAGPIILIVLLATPGSTVENQHGAPANLATA